MWSRLLSWFGRGREEGDGAWGERLAADHLRGLGYTIVARNWRNPRDRREEIDLVCSDGGILVFVEVKTRSASALVPGYHAAVTPRKKKVLLRACRAYLSRLPAKPHTHRFDVVEVATRPDAPPEVRHFENVPLFP